MIFKKFYNYLSDRSHLKNWILVQAQGGIALQPAGILKYVEDLERGPNTEIGPKDFFETASRNYGRLLRGFRQYLDLLPIAGKGVLIGVVKIARVIQRRFEFDSGAVKPDLYIVYGYAENFGNFPV